MISIGIWRLKSKLSKLNKRLLDNIQQMLAQLLNNRNNDENTASNHDKEENADMEPPRLKSQKEVLQLMLMLSKASKLRSHP